MWKGWEGSSANRHSPHHISSWFLASISGEIAEYFPNKHSQKRNKTKSDVLTIKEASSKNWEGKIMAHHIHLSHNMSWPSLTACTFTATGLAWFQVCNCGTGHTYIWRKVVKNRSLCVPWILCSEIYQTFVSIVCSSLETYIRMQPLLPPAFTPPQLRFNLRISE